MEAIACCRPEFITVPISATPTVEPTLRKNWVDAVATPRSRLVEAFWITRTYCCETMPMPVPRITIASDSCHGVEVWLSRVRKATPTPMITMPASISSL